MFNYYSNSKLMVKLHLVNKMEDIKMAFIQIPHDMTEVRIMMEQL